MTSKQFRHTIVAASVAVAAVILLFSMGLIPSMHLGSKGAGQSRGGIGFCDDLEPRHAGVVAGVVGYQR